MALSRSIVMLTWREKADGVWELPSATPTGSWWLPRLGKWP
ncbi:hypothetical protein A2U01_0104110, partial [Trifolium medium]|nr:hypothetical protein [Trifolium medium]